MTNPNPDPSPGKFREFLSVREVAEILGVSERQVWRFIRNGDLPTHGFGRSTRIKRSDLDDFITRRRR